MSSHHGGNILLGYLAACVAVAIGMWGLPALLWMASGIFGGGAWRPPAGASEVATTAVILLVYVASTIMVTIVLTAVPSLLLIAIAERVRLRAWWAYAIGAGLIGLLSYCLLPLAVSWTRGAPFSAYDAALCAALGAMAGALYWFIGVRGREEIAQASVQDNLLIDEYNRR